MSTLDDLAQVIDRIPLLGTVRTDLAQLRRLVADRRAPRMLAIGAPGAGRTTLANELLAASALPAEAERAELIAPEAQWLHVRAHGRSLDWLELDALPLTGTRRERLERALRESPPDVILLVARADALDAPALARTLHEVRALLGERAVSTLALRTGGASVDEGALEALRRALAEQRVEVPRPSPLRRRGDRLDADELRALADELYVRLPDVAHVEAARTLPVGRDKKREVARLLVQRASTIAVTVGLAPIPFSDALILVPLQSLMVTSVAYVAGQPWDARAAAEWLGSVGLLGGAAFGLRWGAQQLVKLVPGAGTLLSASVAGTGTLAIGRSAIAYFIDGPGLRRPTKLLPAPPPG